MAAAVCAGTSFGRYIARAFAGAYLGSSLTVLLLIEIVFTGPHEFGHLVGVVRDQSTKGDLETAVSHDRTQNLFPHVIVFKLRKMLARHCEEHILLAYFVQR